jgi:DNA polymerase-2
VPNRYFGVFQDGSLKIRGIDARRRDTPPFINQAQMQVLELLKQHPNPEQALPAVLQHLRMCMRQLQDYNVPLEDLLVKKRLGRDLTAYRTLPASARAALQLEEIGKTLSPGQRVVFLYMLGKPGVHAWDLGTRPDIHRIDVAYYQELLLRAASTILQPWIKNETLLKNLIFQHGLQPPLPVPQKFHPPKHLESQIKHSFSLLQPSYQS